MANPAETARDDVSAALAKVFGFRTFRPNQEAIVRAVLEGRDVFAVMPTGGGKSLCYQLPAHLLDGVCVVVSPLISLMKDQVDAAVANGLRAAQFNSTLSPGEKSDVAAELRDGRLDLLYVSPERFAVEGFVEMLQGVKVCLLAIDEAHCISEWGHDFRPDYLQLGNLAHWFAEQNVPLAAFTATATHRVQSDIVRRLGLRDPLVVRASFDRPNLFYQIEPKDAAEQQIAEFLKVRKGQPAIVYRTTRKDVEATAAYLQQAGVAARPYHAGLDARVRQGNQDAFSRDEVDVIVATIAFGMGIDKSNVRIVIHGDLPKNIESYYQETGRAGRDGAPAQCLLLFSMADVPTLRFFVNQIANEPERKAASRALAQMIDFAEAPQCRRRGLLGYFGERYPHEKCDNCDVCAGPVGIHEATVDAQKAMSAVARTEEQLGVEGVIDLLLGRDSEAVQAAGGHEVKTFGVGADQSPEHWQHVIDQLLRQGCLVASEDGRLQLSRQGREVLFGRRTFHLLRAKPRTSVAPAAASRKSRSKAVALDEGPYDTALFERLRETRRELAEGQGIPPFIVASDRTLQDMARQKPRSLGELAEVSGIGEVKLARYGPAFLRTLTGHLGPAPRGNAVKRISAGGTKGKTRLSREQSVAATWRLLQQGMTPEEVCAKRKLSESTVVRQMETLLEQGKPVDLSILISQAEQNELERLFDQHGLRSLAKIIQAGEGRFSYTQARLVRAKLSQPG